MNANLKSDPIPSASDVGHDGSVAPAVPVLPVPPSRLIPVTAWPLHHDWPTVPGLRWMIFNAKTNGFDAVVRRVGRRVLIDERAFFQWVEDQNRPAF